jgi:hypothetical protein
MPLFYDDEFHALRACIESSEKDYKACAAHLWPTMKPESAYAKLKACVNEPGRERLRLGEIVALMRFTGRADALYFLCDETLHVRPQRVAPEDAEAQALTIVDEATDKLERALKTLGEYRSMRQNVPAGLRK